MKSLIRHFRFKKYKGTCHHPHRSPQRAHQEQYASNRTSTRTGAATTSIWCSRRGRYREKPTA